MLRGGDRVLAQIAGDRAAEPGRNADADRDLRPASLSWSLRANGTMLRSPRIRRASICSCRWSGSSQTTRCCAAGWHLRFRNEAETMCSANQPENAVKKTSPGVEIQLAIVGGQLPRTISGRIWIDIELRGPRVHCHWRDQPGQPADRRQQDQQEARTLLQSCLAEYEGSLPLEPSLRGILASSTISDRSSHRWMHQRPAPRNRHHASSAAPSRAFRSACRSASPSCIPKYRSWAAARPRPRRNRRRFSTCTLRQHAIPSCQVRPFGSGVPTAGTMLGSKPSRIDGDVDVGLQISTTPSTHWRLAWP